MINPLLRFVCLFVRARRRCRDSSAISGLGRACMEVIGCGSQRFVALGLQCLESSYTRRKSEVVKVWLAQKGAKISEYTLTRLPLQLSFCSRFARRRGFSVFSLVHHDRRLIYAVDPLTNTPSYIATDNTAEQINGQRCSP
jgi:hypothetical protein